jgi:RNA polymerase sigma-70 factor (ECF subfamily)
LDDSALVERYRAGDSSALEGLILRYQGRLYNVIYRMCQNPDDAAELVQDTFVKVIENIDTFQRRSSFYTWVFRIAVNLTINYCQRKGKISFESIEAENFGDAKGEARAALKEILHDGRAVEPDAVADDKELCGLLEESIARLDDDYRAVIVLRDIEGMNYAQIAASLGIEIGTVKSRLSRARNTLREILEGYI